jgi:hypothetical protein
MRTIANMLTGRRTQHYQAQCIACFTPRDYDPVICLHILIVDILRIGGGIEFENTQSREAYEDVRNFLDSVLNREMSNKSK